MPETILVPLSGETVNAGAATDGGGDWVNGRWTPGSRTRRGSLHDIHIKPSSAQEETAAPAPIEVPQYAQSYAPAYAPTYDQQQAGYTQPENYMQNDNHGGPPNPLDFDLYDEESARDYNQQLAAYIDGRVASALTPSKQAQNDAEAVAQYNKTFERFGSDENFKQVLDEALHACLRDAKAGRAVDIEKAYELASGENSKRAGRRTEHLPSRVKSVKTLGQLIQFNHDSKRARPFAPRRGW